MEPGVRSLLEGRRPLGCEDCLGFSTPRHTRLCGFLSPKVVLIPVIELFAVALALFLKETRSDTEIEVLNSRAKESSNFLFVS